MRLTVSRSLRCNRPTHSSKPFVEGLERLRQCQPLNSLKIPLTLKNAD